MHSLKHVDISVVEINRDLLTHAKKEKLNGDLCTVKMKDLRSVNQIEETYTLQWVDRVFK